MAANLAATPQVTSDSLADCFETVTLTLEKSRESACKNGLEARGTWMLAVGRQPSGLWTRAAVRARTGRLAPCR